MNSRDKGARGERSLANILKNYGFNARRGQQYSGSPDSPDVVGLPNIHIECKRVERLNLTAAYEQSFRDAGENEFPVVMHKKNKEPWFVTMSLEDFMKLYMASRYSDEKLFDPYAVVAREMLE